MTLERREFQTTKGTVVLSGDFKGNRPIVVVIRGAYADAEMFAPLQTILLEARVLFGEIPGNRCPLLSEQSVEAYRVAYSEALSRLDGPVIVCGLSLGGVIALGLTCSTFAILAIDPPMRPAESVVLQKVMRTAFKKSEDEVDRKFLEEIFLSDNEYMPPASRLLCPTVVLAGDHVGTIPSVLSDGTFEELGRLPMVTTERVPGVGHSVWIGGSARIVEVLRKLSTIEHNQKRTAGTSA